MAKTRDGIHGPILGIHEIKAEFRTPQLRKAVQSCLPQPRKGQPIAVLLTTEFEGIGKNGGVGTYYKELSHRLSRADWPVILVIIGGYLRVNCSPKSVDASCILDISYINRILYLEPLHQAMRRSTKGDGNFRTGLECLFLLQALESHYPNTKIYAEFHEMFGYAHHSVQAKQTKLLSDKIAIGVTMHSGHEWIFDANRALIRQESRNLLRISTREEQSFAKADLAMYPSDSLHEIVKSFGWTTHGAIRMPYFIPLHKGADSTRGALIGTAEKTIEVIFFGRLEERKGLFEFIEAIRCLQSSDRRKQFKVTFLGKSIRLHSLQSSRITSSDYIKKTLGNHVRHTIISNLSSSEAIAYVQGAASRSVVCLASPSDNFPNAALEMGQIPVSLVVSDTPGFRQTLSLVERETGVFWFKAGSAESLHLSIREALQKLDNQTITVACRGRLEEINQDLQKKRIALMLACLEQSKTKFLPETVIKLEYSLIEDAFITYNRAIQQAKAHMVRFICSSFAGSSPGPAGLNELQQAAQGIDADLVVVGCELMPSGLLCHSALSIGEVLAADFKPPGCMLLQTNSFCNLPPPLAITGHQVHRQLIAAAIMAGMKVAIISYPLTDRPAETNQGKPNTVDEGAQADIAKYLASLPAQYISKRAIFHLTISNLQLQASLARIQPGGSIQQNMVNLMHYLAVPTRNMLNNFKYYLRRMIDQQKGSRYE